MIRSWLFVPGDSRRKIQRGTASLADALIFDWEDGIGPLARAEARRTTIEALIAGPRAGPARWVRVNALDSPEFEEDLRALPLAHIDGVVLPKCCGPADILRLGRELANVESDAELAGPLPVVGIATENAASVLALSEFRRPLPRLAGLMWGAEDLSADLGVRESRVEPGGYRSTFMLARNMTLMAAAAAGCDAIDTVNTELSNIDRLAQDCCEARRDGFVGKAAIHPDQLGAINEIFRSTAAERAWADKVVTALSPGHGVAVVDGRMVDAPHLRLAKRLLAR